MRLLRQAFPLSCVLQRSGPMAHGTFGSGEKIALELSYCRMVLKVLVCLCFVIHRKLLIKGVRFYFLLSLPLVDCFIIG